MIVFSIKMASQKDAIVFSIPDEQPVFVTSVEESRILRVVRAADKIACQLALEQSDVGVVDLIGQRRPELRVHVVAVVSMELRRLAVDQDVAP